MQEKNYRVPAPPIRKVILEWLEEGDMKTLAGLLFPDLKTRAAKDKIFFVLKERCDTVDFDFADLVLCRLDRPELWLEDPVLYEAYCGVDLIALDRARPTREEAA